MRHDVARALAVVLAVVVLAMVVLAAGGPPRAFAQGVFTGEVWNWDEKAGTVSLRQLNGEVVRLKVSPETLIGIRLHQMATIRGELAAPAEIERIQMPAPAMKAVPRGTPMRSEVTGTIATIEPEGAVSVASPQGPLRVWVAVPADRFRAGAAVRVASTVQPMELVPASAGDAAQTPSLAPAPDPGDYAVILGRVLAVGSDGRIVVDSPRGPVTVWVPGTVPYKVGDTVEVRTAVNPAG